MNIDPISARLHRRARPCGPLMLMYHAVTPEGGRPRWAWAVSMRQFQAQLDFLAAEGYATLTQRELAATPPAALPARAVVSTFDDGYRNNLLASAELARRGMRASWFIVTGNIGGAPGWPSEHRPEGRMLDAAELRRLHADGMEVGSHSVSHPRLPTTSDDQLRRELADSRAALEDILGAPVDSFAYPYGAWDARCAAAVAQAGYTSACTTRTGWALRDNDPFRLRRLTVFNSDTTSTLARKLAVAGHNVAWRDIARLTLSKLVRP